MVRKYLHALKGPRYAIMRFSKTPSVTAKSRKFLTMNEAQIRAAFFALLGVMKDSNADPVLVAKVMAEFLTV